MKLNLGENKGFTLTEIMTTLAIVGVVSAVAIPGFARARMEVNQEMVRQRLRELHRDMNDILNGGGQLPVDMGNLGNTEEEISITASLNAIDAKMYTTDGYLPDVSLMNYTYRSGPKPGQMSIAGTKCFLVDLFGVRELFDCIDGTGLASIPLLTDFNGDEFFNFILSDPTLTDAERAEFVEGYIVHLALLALGDRHTLNGGYTSYPSWGGARWIPPTEFGLDRPFSSAHTSLRLDAVNAGKSDELNIMIDNGFRNLQSQGIDIYKMPTDSTTRVPTGYYDDFPTAGYFTKDQQFNNFYTYGCTNGCLEVSIKPRTQTGAMDSADIQTAILEEAAVLRTLSSYQAQLDAYRRFRG